MLNKSLYSSKTYLSTQKTIFRFKYTKLIEKQTSASNSIYFFSKMEDKEHLSGTPLIE
jgi:hypothetical protein